MALTPADKQASIAAVRDKARVFQADPAAGRRAGYFPKPGPSGPPLMSADGLSDDGPPLSFADWLRCVAAKDLQGRTFAVIEYARGEATLEVR